jgi:hypothetical protein
MNEWVNADLLEMSISPYAINSVQATIPPLW